LNKADPFGDMTPVSNLVSGDEPNPDQSSDRPEEPVQADHVGALLCATRMRKGGDLQEIAKVLRIRYGYLVAIEDGRHEDLPGNAYSIGFVRAYADYLGLDGKEVVRRLRDETDGTVSTARFEFPTPSGESGLPNGGLLAIAIAMGMIVYGTWYTLTNDDRDAVDLIQEVPGRLAVLIEDENASPVSLEPAVGEISSPDEVEVSTLSDQPSEIPEGEVTALAPVDESAALLIETEEQRSLITAATVQGMPKSNPIEEVNTLVTPLPDPPEAVEAADQRSESAPVDVQAEIQPQAKQVVPPAE
jgi:cytoskeleton protein RodZ